MRGILIVAILSVAGIGAAQETSEDERSRWSRDREERNRERISVLEERLIAHRESHETLKSRVDRIEEWGVYILLGTGGAFGTAGGSIGLIVGRRNGRKRVDDTRH